MVARYVLGAVLATTMAAPAFAGQKMNADEARKFVSGKVFAFACNDGTRGAGRIFDDGGAAGAVQFSGTAAAKNMRVPGNTLQVRGQNICASLKGLPFEPCFDLEKTSERSFRGSTSVMGGMIKGYCDFRHQGRGQMLMARSLSQPRTMRTRSADASAGGETVTRVSTPRVESSKLEPVTTGAVKSEPAKSEPMELRKSTD